MKQKLSAALVAMTVLGAFSALAEQENPGQENPWQETSGREKPMLEKLGQEKPEQEKPGQAVSYPAGSELYVERSVGKIDYHHAGVYVGGRQVVHVSAEPLGALKDLWDGKPVVNVILSSYEEFAAGDQVSLGPTKPAFPPEEIVKRAKAMVGQSWTYDAEQNNCQHFSSERVGGAALSPEAKQMRKALDAVPRELEARAEAMKSKAEDLGGQAKEKAEEAIDQVKDWRSSD